MSVLTVNTRKLEEIYREWRGNKSCYDNGRPVFEADELLDFAEFCLKHEANVIATGGGQLTIPDVVGRSELLLAMFDLAQTMPNNLTKADKMKVVNKFIANNCA